MEATGVTLDHEELFHLALQASSKGDHDKAIRYLKEGLAISPSAKFYYILGAQHAEIGMYERAVEEMTKALELDDTMDTARFQLGLLKMTMNDVEGARGTWSLLDEKDEGEPLRLFKTSILEAVSGDFVEALDIAQRGIDANNENPALNVDMNNLVERWKASLETEAGGIVSTEAEDEANTNHFFLSAYKDEKND
ncbi:hypothetical protein A9Q81_07540 [Gammaproteobacteria bacterium 42_54_T18]|nr:hypothetical protein A9Q81_07540 [Gammaproteobacteria bacterium 42_54_T18]